jgi:hypothetical protein
MTQPDAAVPDFTIHREPHQFRIDDDLFSAPALLSPITLKRLAAQATALGDVSTLTDADSVTKALEALGDIMTALMPGASGQRFKARLWADGSDEATQPIDLMAQAIPAFYYLMERYGLRPTVPSSPSPDGSTDGQMNSTSEDTSSTDGASPIESISTP